MELWRYAVIGTIAAEAVLLSACGENKPNAPTIPTKPAATTPVQGPQRPVISESTSPFAKEMRILEKDPTMKELNEPNLKRLIDTGAQAYCGVVKCLKTPTELASDFKIMKRPEFKDKLSSINPDSEQSINAFDPTEFALPETTKEVFMNIDALNARVDTTQKDFTPEQMNLDGRHLWVTVANPIIFHAITHVIQDLKPVQIKPFTYRVDPESPITITKMTGFLLDGHYADGRPYASVGPDEAFSTSIAKVVLAKNRLLGTSTNSPYMEASSLLTDAITKVGLSEEDLLPIASNIQNPSILLDKIEALKRPGVEGDVAPRVLYIIGRVANGMNASEGKGRIAALIR